MKKLQLLFLKLVFSRNSLGLWALVVRMPTWRPEKLFQEKGLATVLLVKIKQWLSTYMFFMNVCGVIYKLSLLMSCKGFHSVNILWVDTPCVHGPLTVDNELRGRGRGRFQSSISISSSQGRAKNEEPYFSNCNKFSCFFSHYVILEWMSVNLQ